MLDNGGFDCVYTRRIAALCVCVCVGFRARSNVSIRTGRTVLFLSDSINPINLQPHLFLIK